MRVLSPGSPSAAGRAAVHLELSEVGAPGNLLRGGLGCTTQREENLIVPESPFLRRGRELPVAPVPCTQPWPVAPTGDNVLIPARNPGIDFLCSRSQLLQSALFSSTLILHLNSRD